MGVYQYTRRSDTKTIDGLKLARYAFAYKLGCDGWFPSNTSWYSKVNGSVKRIEAFACRALEKTKDCDFFIVADSFNPEYATETVGIPVFRISDRYRDAYQFTEEASDIGVLCGYLYRRGKKIRFVANAA